MSTTNPRIWAAGDVTGHPESVKGAIAVENAFEHAGRRIAYSALPRITFTSLTIASADVTEAEAHEQGVPAAGGQLELGDSGRCDVHYGRRLALQVDADPVGEQCQADDDRRPVVTRAGVGCSTLTITAEFQIAKPSGQHIYGSTGRGGTGVETISELVVWP